MNKTKNGYHVTSIARGVYGEPDKILEETEEFIDAVHQGSNIMAILELADLYGAIEGYLKKHHPSISMVDIQVMSQITRRAFENGFRR